MQTKTVVVKATALVMSILLLMTPASATNLDVSGNSPRYTFFSEFTSLLSINSSGMASCTACVKTADGPYTITFTMELIQLDTDTVQNTWHASGGTYVRLSDQCGPVPSGHQYIIKISALAYFGSTLIESAYIWSNIVEY